MYLLLSISVHFLFLSKLNHWLSVWHQSLLLAGVKKLNEQQEKFEEKMNVFISFTGLTSNCSSLCTLTFFPSDCICRCAPFKTKYLPEVLGTSNVWTPALANQLHFIKWVIADRLNVFVSHCAAGVWQRLDGGSGLVQEVHALWKC